MSDIYDSEMSLSDDTYRNLHYIISRLGTHFYSPLLKRKAPPRSPERGPSMSLQERIQNIQRDEAVLQSFTTVQNPFSQPLSVSLHSFH